MRPRTSQAESSSQVRTVGDRSTRKDGEGRLGFETETMVVKW